MHSFYPRARRSGLYIQELPDEILLFDNVTHQANCLNATAALVWKNADGTRSVSDIAAQMTQTLGAPVQTGVVWYALQQFSKKQLLQETVAVPPEYAKLTRRDFLAQASMLGVGVVIPTTISLTAPAASNVVSGCLAESTSC